jgi:hypothetical protein
MVFQPSHRTVQPKIMKKNPIEPTYSVSLTAIFSNRVKLSLCLTFELGICFRKRLSSSEAFLSSLGFIVFPVAIPLWISLGVACAAQRPQLSGGHAGWPARGAVWQIAARTRAFIRGLFTLGHRHEVARFAQPRSNLAIGPGGLSWFHLSCLIIFRSSAQGKAVAGFCERYQNATIQRNRPR